MYLKGCTQRHKFRKLWVFNVSYWLSLRGCPDVLIEKDIWTEWSIQNKAYIKNLWAVSTVWITTFAILTLHKIFENKWMLIITVNLLIYGFSDNGVDIKHHGLYNFISVIIGTIFWLIVYFSMKLIIRIYFQIRLGNK